MKTNKSKPTSTETLSAYLDGQLSERETQVLLQRLENDTVLRNQLDDLRQTRYVLRRTPKLKRRRSFVLSPEMVKQQKTFFRAMSVSRMVSAAASVMLVVLLGSQYLFAGGMRIASAPMADSANYAMEQDMPAEEPMMAMEAPADDAAEEGLAMEAPMEEPAAALAEATEELDSGMADLPQETDAAGEPESPAPPVADEPAENAGDLQSTQEPMGGGGEPPAEEAATEESELALPTATTEGDQRAIPQEKDVDETQTGDMDGETVPGLGQADQIIPGDELETGGGQPAGLQISALQIVQGILLILAIAGGLTAAYFRKKVR